jgi:surface carbohydrate biosynthesis protein (TIGR04326 family)
LLYQLEIVRLALNIHPCDRGLVFVEDTDLYDVLTELLKNRQIEVIHNRSRGKLLGDKSIIRHLYRRCYVLAFVLTKWITIRLLRLFPSARTAHSSDNRKVAFYSWFPSQWIDFKGGFVDKYYVDLPAFIHEYRDYRPTYACLLHVNGSFKAYFRFLRSFGRDLVSGKYSDINFLEEDYASLLDIFGSFLNLRTMWRYLALEKGDKSFKESFTYDDVNIFKIVYNDFRVSFLGWTMPFYLLTARTMEKFVRATRVQRVITYFESYCFERALVYGAKRAAKETEIIGYQLSAITKMKLPFSFHPGELMPNAEDPYDYINNVPIPDKFALHGEFAKNILVASGFPEHHLHVTGSPRFDVLAEFILDLDREKIKKSLSLDLPKNRKVVLITTSIQPCDTKSLLKSAIEALSKRNDCFAIFKPHPGLSNIAPIISEASKESGFKDYLLLTEDVHKLIAVSDVLVVTYSTTGVEALAIGRPVICMSFGNRPDVSPFAEMEGAALTARDAYTLNEALDVVFYDHTALKSYTDNSQKLTEGTFYKLDGKAKERFLEVLEP